MSTIHPPTCAAAATPAAGNRRSFRVHQSAYWPAASITAAVNAGLIKDSELSAIKINVDTKDGVVTLTGEAPNQAAKDRAGRISVLARALAGTDTRKAIRWITSQLSDHPKRWGDRWIHRSAWTKEIIAEEMRIVGFEIVHIGIGLTHGMGERDFRVEGIKRA
jgi:hypothetical protein